jgi:hypothetical protein
VATAATAFFLDATGLSRGGPRWWLPPPPLFSLMPRACPVEAHVGGYRRRDREAPRGKPVASRREAAGGRGQREPPRHKAVASEVVNAQKVSSLQLEPFRNGAWSGARLYCRVKICRGGSGRFSPVWPPRWVWRRERGGSATADTPYRFLDRRCSFDSHFSSDPTIVACTQLGLPA